jgi:hypothetical protein
LRSIGANPHNASPYFNLGLAYEKTASSNLPRCYYQLFMSIENPRYEDLIARVKKHLVDMLSPENRANLISSSFQVWGRNS